MTRRIGILKCGDAPDAVQAQHGDYPAHFEMLFQTHDFLFDVYEVHRGHFPDNLEDGDGWLVTGSKHGAYDPLDWIAPLEALIRQLHAAKTPLIGICFGHQIIAQALGGTVETFDGGWTVGRQSYVWDGQPIHLNAWHQDQVIAPPPGAITRASNAVTDHAALQYGGHCLTVQAHPEFSIPILETLMDARGPGRVPPDRLQHAREALSGPLDSTRVATDLAAILKG